MAKLSRWSLRQIQKAEPDPTKRALLRRSTELIAEAREMLDVLEAASEHADEFPQFENAVVDHSSESPGRRQLYAHVVQALGLLAIGQQRLVLVKAGLTEEEMEALSNGIDALVQLLAMLERTPVTDAIRGGRPPGELQ
jgi:hypothetical protein